MTRARNEIRRYAIANDLATTITLGYADRFLAVACDWERVGRDTGLFLRRCRGVLGGRPMPYVHLRERQPGRSADAGVTVYNGMALVRRIPREAFGRVLALWEFGPEAQPSAGCDIRTRAPSHGGARSAAGYASKYLAKDLGDVPAGRHRYDLAHGFAVQRSESLYPSSVGALAAASAAGLTVHYPMPDRPVWAVRRAEA